MKTLMWACALVIGIAGLSAVARGSSSPAGPGADPAQVVPLAEIAPGARDAVSEIIRDNTFHHQGAAETFPCHSRIYLSLLNEPALTLALWKDLSASPVRLDQV